MLSFQYGPTFLKNAFSSLFVCLYCLLCVYDLIWITSLPFQIITAFGLCLRADAQKQQMLCLTNISNVWCHF